MLSGLQEGITRKLKILKKITQQTNTARQECYSRKFCILLMQGVHKKFNHVQQQTTRNYFIPIIFLHFRTQFSVS